MPTLPVLVCSASVKYFPGSSALSRAAGQRSTSFTVGDVCPAAVARQVRAGIRDYCGGFDRQRNGYRMACKPLTGSRQGSLAGPTTPQLLDPIAAGAGVPSRGQASCPGLSLVACLVVAAPAGTCRTALRNALGARGVKLVAALDAPSGDRCSPAHRKTGAGAGSGQHFSRGIHSSLHSLPRQRRERTRIINGPGGACHSPADPVTSRESRERNEALRGGNRA